ncbi:MAG: hypothetical protein JKY48_17245 [Flavobacteriales bacterium]|nr:hypothetical protein [Flavobacteriales bacterium]
MNFSKLTLISALILHCFQGFSQNDIQADSSETIPFIRFQYSFLLPSGDFETSYGNSSSVGGAIGLKSKSNWQFEFEYSFMFGADLKRKDLLSDIINEAGDVTDSDGELIKIIYDLRGYSIFSSVGKIFPISKKNLNSGILVQAGIGFLQHRIFIDYRDGEAFQLNKEMLKGYDRLHNGLALKQFVGYQYFGSKNLINFYIGVEFQEGFTKNKREYNYDTKSFDKNQKNDFLYGLRLGWSIPIRKRTSDNFYYY